MRVFDRYLGALLIFTFGFVTLMISGMWLRRGSFVSTVQGQSRLISSSETPQAFFGYTIPSLFLGTLLVAFSIYVALRVYRTPESEALRPTGSLVAMRAMGFFFIVIIIVLTVRFLRA